MPILKLAGSQSFGIRVLCHPDGSDVGVPLSILDEFCPHRHLAQSSFRTDNASPLHSLTPALSSNFSSAKLNVAVNIKQFTVPEHRNNKIND